MAIAKAETECNEAQPPPPYCDLRVDRQTGTTSQPGTGTESEPEGTCEKPLAK